jgi:hypothetical protein
MAYYSQTRRFTMSQFEIIKSFGDIKLGKEWVDAPNYKNRLVDDSGKTVLANHEGRKYLLISKKERPLTFCERALRIFIVAVAVICTVGAAWLLQSVREFSAKKKESREFGMQIAFPHVSSKGNSKATASNLEQIKSQPAPKLNPPAPQANQLSKAVGNAEQARLKAFFQSITPANINEMLKFEKPGFKPAFEPNFYLRITYHAADEFYPASYDFTIHRKEEGESWTGSGILVENGRFKHHVNGTRDKYEYFDNLDQYLQYLFKGFFYQGSSFNSSKLFWILTKDGLVSYQNPYKAQDQAVYQAYEAKACAGIKAPK